MQSEGMEMTIIPAKVDLDRALKAIKRHVGQREQAAPDDREMPRRLILSW
jgi:hypothetical protein